MRRLATFKTVTFPRTLVALALLALLTACQTPRVAEPPAPAQPPPQIDMSIFQPIEPPPPPPPPPATRVGLLLPLSGPNAALGRALRNAAEMALFDVGDESLILVPRDTGGTPEGAARAAEEVIAEGVQLILGPVFAQSVTAMSRRAREARISVVAFSSDRLVAGDGVYILGLLPGDQVERVVGFTRAQGLQRFAAVVPSDAFGATVASELRRVAPGLGAEVTTIEFYNPEADDAAQAVQRLAQFGGAGAFAFDAVLLPEGGDRLRALAPLLPFYDIDPAQVRILGSAQWETGSPGQEPSLVGAWYAAADPQMRVEFERRYAQLYGREPPRLATLAYDATALASLLARGPNGPDFSADALASPNGFAGTEGIFRFRPDGTTQRGLAVFEVRPEGPRMIDPSPDSFEDLTY